MKTNIRKSLDLAITLKKGAMIVNNKLNEQLEEHPDLDDDLQVLMCELVNNMVKLYEATHQAIEAYTEQLQIFGEEGIEKHCTYQRSENE